MDFRLSRWSKTNAVIHLPLEQKIIGLIKGTGINIYEVKQFFARIHFFIRIIL